jgi:hypothetical protein
MRTQDEMNMRILMQQFLKCERQCCRLCLEEILFQLLDAKRERSRNLRLRAIRRIPRNQVRGDA